MRDGRYHVGRIRLPSQLPADLCAVRFLRTCSTSKYIITRVRKSQVYYFKIGILLIFVRMYALAVRLRNIKLKVE